MRGEGEDVKVSAMAREISKKEKADCPYPGHRGYVWNTEDTMGCSEKSIEMCFVIYFDTDYIVLCI